MSTYAAKFKDIRWQKKRLEVLARHEWICQRCCDDDATLHVHHRYYRWGVDPWDYPDDALAVLCEDCHEDETPERKVAKQRLIEGVMGQLFARDVGELATAIEWAIKNGTHLPEVTASVLVKALMDRDQMKSLVDWYFDGLRNARNG